MKRSTLTLTLALFCCVSAGAQEPASVQVREAPKPGEVTIGGPLRSPAPAQAVPATPPGGDTSGLPLIGGAAAPSVLEPGKVVPVYTTMQSAAQAGVNPMAADAASASPAVVAAPLNITDETFWGRISALPLGFKAGALLLLGIAGYALREWRRS